MMKLILDCSSNKFRGHIHEEMTANIPVALGSFMHRLGGSSIRAA